MRFPFFFFNDTATTEIYTLSLHDALPISSASPACPPPTTATSRCSTSASTRLESKPCLPGVIEYAMTMADRKSTRLNSSHTVISYAVFCLKKKKNIQVHNRIQRIDHARSH